MTPLPAPILLGTAIGLTVPVGFTLELILLSRALSFESERI